MIVKIIFEIVLDISTGDDDRLPHQKRKNSTDYCQSQIVNQKGHHLAIDTFCVDVGIEIQDNVID